MASYAETSEDTPVDRAKRTLAFASATSSEAPTPAGPPLSPYRDPSANCDPSEAPTPVRERRRESPPPDEPENAEEESLRLALELQEREERYVREQEEGAARHRALTPTTRSPDGRRRRAVDASQRWRAAHSAVRGQPLLRQPCVACVDGAVQAIRAKQALCPAAALVRVGIAFAPGSLLKLAFASVLQAASARSPLQVTRAVSTGGRIGEG